MRVSGIYVHIPFCAKKCGYCDFNAYSGYKDGTKARYVDALCREIENFADPATRVPTIFFGGGTPTMLSASALNRILATIQASFTVDQDAEISIEANPDDASPEYLTALREGGFNRLSFGVQTFNDRLLKMIDRIHDGDAARRAVTAARIAGFDNISIDLMFALPRQTLADWETTLDSAFALDVPHLSIYSLIVEEGTPFYARRERGRMTFPSEKAEAAMFGAAIQRAVNAGYQHYEVSNYAKPDYESRHNQIYWRNEEYYGFGAGAVGYRDSVRATNIRRPTRYIETALSGGNLTEESEKVSLADTMGETIMLGLRLRAGIDLQAFADRFGIRMEERYASEIERYVRAELLECTADHIRLTQRGLFLANEVMAAFLP